MDACGRRLTTIAPTVIVDHMCDVDRLMIEEQTIGLP
jgi:hypothetical protein